MLSLWTEIHNGVTNTAFSLLVSSLEGLASNALNKKGKRMALPETIEITWHVNDILERCELRGIEIDKPDAIKLLHEIHAAHDASIGINWEVIDDALDYWPRYRIGI